MTDHSQPLFLYGPGYSARALAALWQGKVYGAVRPQSAEKYAESDWFELISTADSVSVERRIYGGHVLVSAAPREEGCPALNAIGKLAETAASVTYLSTTGVYGNLDGGWAMDWSDANPQSIRGERRVAAEQAWLNARPDARIVRLPGIYGPGRSPLDRVREGRARRVIKPGQVFSRAHVGDIATGLLALINADVTGIFNLCDEEAAPPQDVIAFAAELLGMEAPPEISFEEADLSAMAQSFYSECKRVSNARLKAATGWKPTYPTYREGMRAIFEACG